MKENESFSTHMFVILCQRCNLDIMLHGEDMTIGNCLDYIDTFIEVESDLSNNNKKKKATQEDIDRFF